MSWLFASGGQSIGASASILPMNIQGWFPLGLTGLISLHRIYYIYISQFSHSVVSDSPATHELQHARPPCPSSTPRVYPNPRPLSRWCHLTISSSVVPFSCPQSFPASGSFPMSWLFTSGGQSIGASASILPMNIQGWFPLGLTGLISLHRIYYIYISQLSHSVVSDSPATPWTATRQASLSITNSQRIPKPTSTESVMPSNRLILCRPLLLPSIFPSIRVFSNESILIRWSKYWSFSFSITPSNEHPGLISFRMDLLDLLAV